jgi:hypothetical protein
VYELGRGPLGGSHQDAREGSSLLDRSAKGVVISNVVRLTGKVVRVALLVIGMALGSISWLLFAYATITLLSSTLSRWGAVPYGGALITEVIGVAWGVSGYRRPPSRLATALGVAGWICSATNLVILNIFPAVL